MMRPATAKLRTLLSWLVLEALALAVSEDDWSVSEDDWSWKGSPPVSGLSLCPVSGVIAAQLTKGAIPAPARGASY